jgi:Flp pilus assembly protein TadD/ABC-type amino acid transport system permease subunit
MFLLTWVIGGFVVVFENEPQIYLNRRKEGWTFGPGIYIYVTLLVFFISIIIHARNIRPALDSLNTITFYYIGMGILTFLVAWSSFLNLPLPEKPCRKFVCWVYPVPIFLTIFIIFYANINPIKADIYFKQGQISKEGKYIDRAIQFNRLAITLAPDQGGYHAELSRTLMIKAESVSDPEVKNLIFEECFKSLEQARQINPLNTQNYSLLGYLFHTWGKIDLSPEGRREKLNQSHFYFKQAVHYNPHDILAYHLWAQVFLTQGDFDGALDKLNNSLSLYPRFGSTYFSLGEIYSAQGKLAEAEESYWQAITYEPHLAKAHSALGYLAFKKGNLLESKDFLLEALQLDPDQATARSLLGIIYFKSGQMEQAIEENLKVLRLHPDDLSSHNNLALIYKKIGRYKEALTYAQKAFELSPESDRPAIQKFIDQLMVKSSTNKTK